MAVLGYEGTVELSREWPLPTVVDDIRVSSGPNPGLDVTEPAFWSGDRVLIFCERGVPFDTANGSRPDCPQGYSFYGTGPYVVGPAISTRISGNSFYGNPATYAIRPFYESQQQVGLTKRIEAYAHRDEMDNLRFYSNELAAINGGTENLIQLFRVDFGKLIIANYVDDPDYLQFLEDSAEKILTGEIEISADEQSLENLPENIEAIVGDPDIRGWHRQGDLTDWVFEMDANQLDQTSVGDVFGEFAKGTLSGSGSFNAIFSDRKREEDRPSSDMLKFLTLTARGSKATARFKMDTVFYETDILFFRTQVSTTVDDVIKLTAEFISTGAVRIVPGWNG